MKLLRVEMFMWYLLLMFPCHMFGNKCYWALIESSIKLWFHGKSRCLLWLQVDSILLFSYSEFSSIISSTFPPNVEDMFAINSLDFVPGRNSHREVRRRGAETKWAFDLLNNRPQLNDVRCEKALCGRRPEDNGQGWKGRSDQGHKGMWCQRRPMRLFISAVVQNNLKLSFLVKLPAKYPELIIVRAGKGEMLGSRLYPSIRVQKPNGHN